MSRPGIRAAVFDLDGTILDSEPAYFESDRAFLAGWGIDYTRELNAAMIGRGSSEFLRDLETLFPGNALHGLPLAERLRLKDEAYLSHASGRVRAFPAMDAFIAFLRGEGVPLAIASGSSHPVIDATLSGAGLLDAFGVRVSASDVRRGKPEPDIFLEAARRLGAQPGDCLVFEDSIHGVRAAKSAGMAVVALPPRDAPPAGYEAADLVVEGGPSAFRPQLVLEIGRAHV